VVYYCYYTIIEYYLLGIFHNVHIGSYDYDKILEQNLSNKFIDMKTRKYESIAGR
jgi:hypothetical protein